MPVAQHGDAVGDREDFFQAVADVDRRHAAAAQVPHEVEQTSGVGLRESCCRLVEHEDLGALGERSGDLDHLLLPDAESADRHVDVKIRSHVGERLACARAKAIPLDQAARNRLAPEHQVLGHCHLGHECELLCDDGYAAALSILDACQMQEFSPKPDLAFVSSVRVEARKDLDERALPRAVFAAERVDLPLLELEGDAVESSDARKLLRDRGERQERHATVISFVPVSLTAGSRLGPYEILAPLGAGGMGEVYKARDTRLERTVAVKVLPSHLSQSEEVRLRFEREAKTISQLSHPHICALYDVGTHEGTEYLVMELLEGETLAARLAKGALPLEQTLRFGIEIADALDKAHRKGIVHRDLKPGNVMLTKSGVKLLDFGLAKVMEPERPQSSLTSLPTMAGAPNLTQEGTILGTFQYMAPEQLEGKEADGRTDIFALGAVLYEMATGRKAFSGASQASLISSIMSSEPAPISANQPMAPTALDRVAKVCLAKDPEDRWQSAHDVGSELKWIAEGSGARVAVARAPRGRRWKTVAAVLLAGILGSVLTALVLGRRAAAPAAAVVPKRFALDLPVTMGGDVIWGNSFIAISPDGSKVVTVTRGQIWLRRLESLEALPVPGTDGGQCPFFSPDGEWLGFWSDGKLKRVRLRGGGVQTIVSVDLPLGATWGPNDIILFGTPYQGLMRVSASGGALKQMTRPTWSSADWGHRFPAFLPGGRTALFTIVSARFRDDEDRVAVLSLDTGTIKVIARGGLKPVYVPPGHLLVAQGGQLLAAPFDLERLAVTGPAVPVLENVFMNSRVSPMATYDVSATGTLAYVPGYQWSIEGRLVWFDRRGHVSPASPTKRAYSGPRLSPDGRRIAVLVRSGLEVDLFVGDFERDIWTRLTQDGSSIDDRYAWSADGRWIAYISTGGGMPEVRIIATDGSGSGRSLIRTSATGDYGWFAPTSFTPDGQTLAIEAIRRDRSGSDIMALSLQGEEPRPREILATRFTENFGTFSPDGKTFAYMSDESGRAEVYMRPWPMTGPAVPVSQGGGEWPRWILGGREIAFISSGRLMSASVGESGGLRAGSPRLLFDLSSLPGLLLFRGVGGVSPDGERFLAVERSVEAPIQRPVLIPGFTDELRALGRGEK